MRPGTGNTLIVLFLFVAAWLLLRFLLPLLAPFVVGLLLAMSAEPLVSLLHRRARLPRSISAGIGVSMSFFLLAMLLALLCAFAARELRVLAGVLPDLEQAIGSGISMLRTWLLELAGRAPRSLRPVLQENVSSLFSGGAALVDQAVRYLLGLAGNLLSHVPDSALGIGTAVISGYMFSAKLPRIRRWLLRHIPKERLRSIRQTLRRLKTVVIGWLTAQLKLMGVTLTIVTLGLILLRVPYAFLWALGISLVDAFPVLGTGTVLLPWGLISLLRGDTARAIGLVGIYATVTLTRSVLEPRLLGSHLGLDPLVTLIALYAGYKLWGIGGMILAPLLAVIATQTIPERKREDK